MTFGGGDELPAALKKAWWAGRQQMLGRNGVATLLRVADDHEDQARQPLPKTPGQAPHTSSRTLTSQGRWVPMLFEEDEASRGQGPGPVQRALPRTPRCCCPREPGDLSPLPKSVLRGLAWHGVNR